MKIAILSINTDKYNIFFDIFYKSSKQNFFPSAERKWFVFSDQNYSHYDNTTTILIKHEEWPFCSLKRFEYFLKIEKSLLEFDYVFFFNSNSEFINKVDGNDFGIGSDKELIAYKNIWLQCKNKDQIKQLLYNVSEHNKKSNAYIDSDLYTYCQGCIIGGKPDSFINMCKTINKWITIDLQNKMIPVWHDESYFNKYQYLNQNIFHYLSEYTVFPENFKFKNNKILTSVFKRLACIKLLNKNNFFNTREFKGWTAADENKIYLNGRLGNVLFYIANAISKYKNNITQICVSKNQQHDYIYKLLKHFNLDYYVQSTNKAGFNVEGYQSEKYFDINLIKNTFKFDETLFNVIDELKNFDFDNAVSITVRRGDYVTLNSIWKVTPKEWYEDTYKKYFNNNPILISSDDIDWCKNNINISNAIYINDYTDDIIEVLYYLSKCKHHIGSCSTFSWWCAWLNEQPDSKIFFPKQWFNHDKRQLNNVEIDIENNIIPERWNRI